MGTAINKTQTIRIFLVDDHPVVRAGLAITLSGEAGFLICGEAENMQDAIALIKDRQPDLVLVDVDLEESSGLDLVREIKIFKPELPVMVLSMHDEELYAERALRLGARGYLMKNESPASLIIGIKTVLSGGIAVSERMKSLVLRRMVEKGSVDLEDDFKSLSDRELEVFRQIGKGLGTRKIADNLCLSIKTVETHMAHIKRKLRLETGIELQHRAFHWTQGQH